MEIFSGLMDLVDRDFNLLPLVLLIFDTLQPLNPLNPLNPLKKIRYKYIVYIGEAERNTFLVVCGFSGLHGF